MATARKCDLCGAGHDGAVRVIEIWDCGACDSVQGGAIELPLRSTDHIHGEWVTELMGAFLAMQSALERTLGNVRLDALHARIMTDALDKAQGIRETEDG